MINQHFPKNTVSAEKYCARCGKMQQHRVDVGRFGPCLECIARAEELKRQEGARKQQQGELFR